MSPKIILKITAIVIILVAVFFGGVLAGNKYIPNLGKDPALVAALKAQEQATQLIKDKAVLTAAVLPSEGFTTKIKLGDAMMKLIENGVVDMEKVEQLYGARGGLTPDQQALFSAPSDAPLTINRSNAQFMVNVLWPIGIANKSLTLTESEAGKPENVMDLAATGGWILGKKPNGGYYYNKFEIVKLTPEQDALVYKIAQNIFRPCCGNSTAFPDCNHGAAILGMLELGASQGLTEDELYQEALKFNSFWFPDQYTKMAMVLRLQQPDKDWTALDPKTLLSAEYSSGMGFRNNVNAPYSKIPGLNPQQSASGGCGV